MNQLEQDIYNATMHKLACYAKEMEKTATPKLKSWLNAVSNRKNNIEKVIKATRDALNTAPYGQAANNGRKAVLETNIGARGNKLINTVTGGLSDTVRSGNIDPELASKILNNSGRFHSESMRLFNDGSVNEVFNELSKGNNIRKYLKKMLPGVDDRMLTDMVNNPINYV